MSEREIVIREIIESLSKEAAEYNHIKDNCMKTGYPFDAIRSQLLGQGIFKAVELIRSEYLKQEEE